MKLDEILAEGAIKRAIDNGTYNKPAKKVGKFYISVNGKPWGNFDTEKTAMQAAERLYAKNPKLRISVVPR